MGKYTTTIRHTSKPLRVLLRLAASASPSTHHGNVRPKPDLPRASPVPRQHLPQRPGARLTRSGTGPVVSASASESQGELGECDYRTIGEWGNTLLRFVTLRSPCVSYCDWPRQLPLSTHRHSQPQPTRHWWSPVPRQHQSRRVTNSLSARA